MRVTDAQVRKLMTEYDRHGRVEKAGLAAGMSRNTATKYVKAKKLPSELKEPRSWRTRPNPFEADWADIAELLEALPELEAKTLFDHFSAKFPDRYEPGQVRTLQRHVRQWRAEQGPPKEVFFAQEHRPGEAMQTDFTWGKELGITIAGEPFEHMLCHSVLPYSNWESATVCQSESMAAIKRGVQAALVRLGRSPKFHQTDNSTAATHKLGESEKGARGFNDEYERFVKHYSMTPRTIEKGKSHQNGDVESSNNVLKKRLRQRLLLRGSRDFDSVGSYESWVQANIESANVLRREKLNDELAEMRRIPERRMPEFSTVKTKVSSWSTIRVKHNSYSVPSRLIGEHIEVRAYDDHLEVYFSGKLQLRTPRLVGSGKCAIDYRHIIWSLVRKPGAFARYRYREELFPSLVFRKAYDRILEVGSRSERQADLEYVRLLHLAASTTETEVETALALLLECGETLTADRVKELVSPAPAMAPEMEIPPVDLTKYDELLKGVAS